MARRARVLAAVLVAIALAAVLYRVGPWSNEPAPSGPPVPGARGKLAYIRDGDVWVYDLRVGVERRLTQGGGHSTPQWSGNGLWVSYTRNGQVWIIRHDGLRATVVPGADLPASARWSPRSARLAFASSDGSLSTFDPPGGANARRIIVPAGNAVGPAIAWSGDGIRLAFERHQPASPIVSNEGIWTIAASGQDLQPVYVASGDYRLTLCCWTRTGGYLLFWQGKHSARAAEGSLPLFITRSTSSQPVPVGDVTLPRESLIDVAPQADSIAFSTSGGAVGAANQLVIAEPMTVRSGAMTVARRVLAGGEGAWVGGPAWAPRSNILAYSLSATTGSESLQGAWSGRIWLTTLPDGASHPLLADATVPAGVSDEFPRWARDEKTLLFVRRLMPEASSARSGAPPATIEVWAATVNGSAARRIVGGLLSTPPPPGDAWDWSSILDYYWE